MRRFHRPLVAALFASGLATAAPSAAFELKHETGTLSVPATPSRLAVYDLGVLDTLNALGIRAVAVPKATFPATLSAYNSNGVPQAGSLFEPDTKALAELKPDLIVVGGRSRKQAEALSALAPTVNLSVRADHFVEDVTGQTLALGKAFGKQKEADTLVKNFEKERAALKKLTGGKSAVMLFTLNGNVMVHAPGDRFGYLHELTGFNAVVPKAEGSNDGPRPPAGSPEAKARQEAAAALLKKAVAANPEWLVVLDRGAATGGGENKALETLARHPELSQTRAFKQGRVIVVDAPSWYIVGGGIANVTRIIQDTTRGLKK
ncbi:siderophore ABC transporter substrate-binding protein [Myxococcus virescens]|uniref:Iron ABC transporter substrate-binding protein n=1 Tax=Myxococcus virescens TaxID=83456 RepID=A0A511HRF7_9BACT|nr:ABC transporter substrate-binding protein [Myxococcus virescens]GEL75079.1 iron ABC transporter substrate-binding protein [Myxococcus virescens]SDE71195.1 iron complex transport system substrate-binding protein [Myxococcus virescens]